MGGGTSATPGGGSYVILQSVTNQITDLDTATLALNITATQGGPTSGYLVAYPTGATKPATSNIDYNPNQTVANLALVPTGTSSQITIYNQNAATSTVRLIVDCAGYFADN